MTIARASLWEIRKGATLTTCSAEDLLTQAILDRWTRRDEYCGSYGFRFSLG
jgi:hypothetical protein